jgi:hypothetical protein
LASFTGLLVCIFVCDNPFSQAMEDLREEIKDHEAEKTQKVAEKKIREDF